MVKKKILFIGANPIELDNTRTNNEIEEIKNALNRTTKKKIELKKLPNATNEAINNTIIEEQPTIIHFCGHGTSTSLFTHNKHNERLKDKLRDDVLLQIIQNNPTIEYVILNCCFSDKISKTIFDNVEHIKSVIGTTNALNSSYGIMFAKSFYLSLGNNGDFKKAYINGKNTVSLYNIDEADNYKGYFNQHNKNHPFKNLIKAIYTFIIVLSSIFGFLFFKTNFQEWYCEHSHTMCLADVSLELIKNKKSNFYKYGDTLNIYAKTNSEIYIRAFLHTQKEDLLLLADNQKINSTNLFPIFTKKIDINDSRKSSLHIYYSKSPFPKLKNEILIYKKNRPYISNKKVKHQIIYNDNAFKSEYISAKKVENIKISFPIFPDL